LAEVIRDEAETLLVPRDTAPIPLGCELGKVKFSNQSRKDMA
jgi:hypothetical protein